MKEIGGGMKNGGPLSLTFVALELENVFWWNLEWTRAVIDDARDVQMPLDPLIFFIRLGLEDVLFIEEYSRKLTCWFRGMINDMSKSRYIFFF